MRLYDLRRPADALAPVASMSHRALRRGGNDIVWPCERRYICHGRHTTVRAKASENRIERRTVRQFMRSLT